MKNSEPTAYNATEAREIARQAEVELAILLERDGITMPDSRE